MDWCQLLAVEHCLALPHSYNSSTAVFVAAVMSWTIFSLAIVINCPIIQSLLVKCLSHASLASKDNLQPLQPRLPLTKITIEKNLAKSEEKN